MVKLSHNGHCNFNVSQIKTSWVNSSATRQIVYQIKRRAKNKVLFFCRCKNRNVIGSSVTSVAALTCPVAAVGVVFSDKQVSIRNIGIYIFNLIWTYAASPYFSFNYTELLQRRCHVYQRSRELAMFLMELSFRMSFIGWVLIIQLHEMGNVRKCHLIWMHWLNGAHISYFSSN